MCGNSARRCNRDLFLSNLLRFSVPPSSGDCGRPIRWIYCMHFDIWDPVALSSCLIRRLDFFLTFISVICNYTMPFFLKSVFICCSPDKLWFVNIKAYTRRHWHERPHKRKQIQSLYLRSFSIHILYMQGFFTLYWSDVQCMLIVHLQAQADVHHLWYGRRAATRMRSELMASIYDKALKRKDFSGIIGEKQKAEAAEKAAAAAEASGPRKHVVNLQVAIYPYLLPRKKQQGKEEGRKGESGKGRRPEGWCRCGKNRELDGQRC